MIILEGNVIIEITDTLSVNDEVNLAVGGTTRIALADANINFIEEFSIDITKEGYYYRYGWVENPSTDLPLEDYMGRALVGITTGSQFIMILLNKTFNEAVDYFRKYFQVESDEHTLNLLRANMDDSTKVR